MNTAVEHKRPGRLLVDLLQHDDAKRVFAQRRCAELDRDEWEDLCQLADSHRVSPLLYCNLASAAPSSVPDDVRDALRDAYRTNAAHNLLLTSELAHLVERFNAHEIECFPIKGPVLAAACYGDLALRVFSDLDLVVSSTRLRKAAEVLTEAGYSAVFQPAGRHWKRYVRDRHHFVFTRSDRRVCVELHWKCVQDCYAFPLTAESMFSRLGRATVGGAVMDVPSLEDHLLLLCLHGAKNCWERLALVADVDAVLRCAAVAQLDWDGVRRTAAELAGARMLRLGICLAGKLFASPIPADVRSWMEHDGKANRLAELSRKRLLGDVRHRSGFLRQYGYYLAARERFRDKLSGTLRLGRAAWPYVSTPAKLWRFARGMPVNA